METNLTTTTQPQHDAKLPVRRSIPWTQDEIDSLMDYEWSDDSETLNERLEFAIYMNHYESGMNYPKRSLSAAKKKFYEESKKNRRAF